MINFLKRAATITALEIEELHAEHYLLRSGKPCRTGNLCSADSAVMRLEREIVSRPLSRPFKVLISVFQIPATLQYVKMISITQ
jgi:hypothetical protein